MPVPLLSMGDDADPVLDARTFSTAGGGGSARRGGGCGSDGGAYAAGGEAALGSAKARAPTGAGADDDAAAAPSVAAATDPGRLVRADSSTALLARAVIELLALALEAAL